VPTQEFSGGHSPLSFKLHFGERKCVLQWQRPVLSYAKLLRLPLRSTTDAEKTLRFLMIDFHERAGHGLYARIFLSIASADSDQSISPCSRFQLWA